MQGYSCIGFERVVVHRCEAITLLCEPLRMGADEDLENRLIGGKGREGHFTRLSDNCSTQPLSVPYFG